jgi:hypothetical protein
MTDSHPYAVHVPPAADLRKMDDAELYELHEAVGNAREHLRKAHGPVLTEVHRREAKTNEDTNRNATLGAGGSVGSQEN